MEDLRMTTTPADAPASGYLWTNARLLTLETTVSRAAASALLPAGLSLVEPATATLFVADYPETAFGSVYREAAVLLHVEDAKGAALHCPWMVVDDDTALILGREVLGFPKKMAEIELEERAGSVVGTVCRKGVELMRLEATLTQDEPTPEPFFARRMVNAIGTLVTGMKRVDLPPAAERIHSARCGTGRVTLGSSERDPLAALGAASTGVARLGHLDFGSTLASGAPGAQLIGDIEPEWTLRQFFARAR
jgi:acetoacetate decarboxylase